MAGIPTKMKALVKAKAMVSYEYTDVDVPEPKEGEILVKMEYVAICGSDIPLYKVCYITLINKLLFVVFPSPLFIFFFIILKSNFLCMIS